MKYIFLYEEDSTDPGPEIIPYMALDYSYSPSRVYLSDDLDNPIQGIKISLDGVPYNIDGPVNYLNVGDSGGRSIGFTNNGQPGYYTRKNGSDAGVDITGKQSIRIGIRGGSVSQNTNIVGRDNPRSLWRLSTNSNLSLYSVNRKNLGNIQTFDVRFIKENDLWLWSINLTFKPS